MENLEYNEAACELAKSKDLDEIIDLKLLMFKDAGLRHLLKENIEKVVLGDYKKMYEKDIAAHFVCRINGQIAAMTGAFIKSDIPYCYYKTPIYGFIGDVYTLSQYRNKGIASMLNKCALRWLRAKGVASVRLLASTQAESIYKRLGFESTDEMALHFSSVNQAID